MKRLLVGAVCAIWLVHAVCANTANALPLFKKQSLAPEITLPWDDLDERALSLTRQMLEKPTVIARGPAETFPCAPEQYYWLLDNPDRAVVAWRRLGAKCVSIERRGPGKFGYTDETGGDITWETIYQAPGLRVWLAEGKVKPSAVLPLVPVKALIILRHSEGKSPDGAVVMNHQAEVVVHTDSKAASAVTKMMGNSAPKLAEQGLGQLQMFFSALSYYIERHPERMERLFRDEGRPLPPASANQRQP
jgi:hypothetical protein